MDIKDILSTRINELSILRTDVLNELTHSEEAMQQVLNVANKMKSRQVGYQTFISSAMEDPRSGMGVSSVIAEYHMDNTQRLYEQLRTIDKKLSLLKSSE